VRTGVALLLCFALAGCGAGAAEERASSDGGRRAAPPIQEIDEDAAAEVEDLFAELEQLKPVRGACIQEDAECGPQDAIAQDYQAWVASRRPAPGSRPRAIARLGEVRLVVWRNDSDALCALPVARDDAGGALIRSPGPLCETDECADLCAALGAGSTLFALLASRGDELRVTFVDGEQRTYPLTGPLVPGAEDRRVFLLALPDERFWHRLELLRAGATIAEAAGPAETVDPGFGEKPPPGVVPTDTPPVPPGQD
jgi:hypothetical protein